MQAVVGAGPGVVEHADREVQRVARLEHQLTEPVDPPPLRARQLQDEDVVAVRMAAEPDRVGRGEVGVHLHGVAELALQLQRNLHERMPRPLQTLQHERRAVARTPGARRPGRPRRRAPRPPCGPASRTPTWGSCGRRAPAGRTACVPRSPGSTRSRARRAGTRARRRSGRCGAARADGPTVCRSKSPRSPTSRSSVIRVRPFGSVGTGKRCSMSNDPNQDLTDSDITGDRRPSATTTSTAAVRARRTPVTSRPNPTRTWTAAARASRTPATADPPSSAPGRSGR